jgi:hypothetical protein
MTELTILAQLNRLGANKKEVYTYLNRVITITYWNDYFVICSPSNDKASKFPISQINIMLDKIKPYQLVETYHNN